MKSSLSSNRQRRTSDKIFPEYETIFNNTRFSLCYLSPEMEILKINPLMEKLVCRRSSEIEGRHCYDVWGQYAGDDSRRGKQRICDTCRVVEVLRDGGTYTYEKPIQDRYIQITSSPVRDPQGAIIGALECGNDITERVLMEKALRESKHRYFNLFHNNHSMMLLIDPEDGRILDANPSACRFYGYSEKELTSMQITDISEFTLSQASAKMQEVIARGGLHFTCRHRLKSGEIRDVEVYSGPLPGYERLILCSTVHDITARLQAEQEVVRAKETWEKTFDAIPDIITIQDKNRRIIQANKAARDLFRDEPGELAGKPCFEVFRGNDIPCPECPLCPYPADTNSTPPAVIHHNHLDKIFQVSSSVIRDTFGEIQYIVHTAKDITAQKQLEEELFQSHKMGAIGTLAGGIAHDFNNILTAIIGFSELIKHNLSHTCNERIRDIDEVLKAGSRARELVKQILDFSRKKERKLIPLEPHLIVKEALKMLRASLPATILIKEDIDTSCGAVLADPTNLYQIVVNLCINAYQAMENEKGTLGIRLSSRRIAPGEIPDSHIPPGRFIVLSVTDTGHGMDSQTISHIFEPFFTTKQTNGTGLGLSVIQGIVKEYQGFIRVESIPGNGSAFHVHLPAVIKNSMELGEHAGMDLPGGKEHILVVDDEAIIVTLMKRLLEALGYQVTATTEARDALERIRAHADMFDLVITDRTMPELTGFELGREIRKIRPELPVILCTGHNQSIRHADLLAAGLTRSYLNKPVTREMLARIVRSILDAHR